MPSRRPPESIKRWAVVTLFLLANGCAHRTSSPRIAASPASPVVQHNGETRPPANPPVQTAPPTSSAPLLTQSSPTAQDTNLLRATSVQRPSGPPRRVSVLDTSAIPIGKGCLRQLDGLGVRYRELHKPIMNTGIVVNSNLGGIRYYGNGHIPLITDCRLAVTLARLGPLFKKFGIEALRHSGSYVIRRTKGAHKRRLSLHAYGLAIDVHEVVLTDGTHLLVSRNYARGLTHPCSPTAPLLNRLACALRRKGAFKELLTPDSNRAHWNHFHLGIARLKPACR